MYSYSTQILTRKRVTIYVVGIALALPLVLGVVFSLLNLLLYLPALMAIIEYGWVGLLASLLLVAAAALLVCLHEMQVELKAEGAGGPDTPFVYIVLIAALAQSVLIWVSPYDEVLLGIITRLF